MSNSSQEPSAPGNLLHCFHQEAKNRETNSKVLFSNTLTRQIWEELFLKVTKIICSARQVVVQDLATQWLQLYPCKSKTSQEIQRSLQKFFQPDRKPKVIYTDNSLEFGKSCEDLSWNHCTSTPHRSETNEIAERAVRRVKEGTSVVLLLSDLDKGWWADSMECYRYLRNIQDLLSDGKTPYERRFGMPFNGPVILFGAMVEYHPISAKDVSRLHQFGPKIFQGISLGHVLFAARIWKGDIMIADIEELEEMEASELTQEGSMQRKCERRSVLFLYVYAQVGKSFVAPGKFGFCGLSPLRPWWLLWSVLVSCW